MVNEGISSLMIRKYRIVDGGEFQTYFKRSVWLSMLSGASWMSVVYCMSLAGMWKLITGGTHFALTMAFVGSLIVLMLSVLMLEYTRESLIAHE